MQQDHVDYTQTFRQLSQLSRNDKTPQFIEHFKQKDKISAWCEQYRSRLQQENRNEDERQTQMLATNPQFIARNYHLQTVIEAAEKNNTKALDERFTVLQSPFEEHPALEHYAKPPPESGKPTCY